MPPVIYSLLLWLSLPLVLLRLAWKSRHDPAYRRRWRERIAWYDKATPPVEGPRVVFHAVSVGEVHAAQPLIEAFMERHPDHAVLVTTSTPTGSERVKALFGSRVEHVYLPWDLGFAVRHFLERFRPSLLVLLETELWPNLIHGCQAQHCAVVLANARLSRKSFRAYRRLGSFITRTLQELTALAAQSDADAAHFLQLGLPRDRLETTGSLKFDVRMAPEKVERARHLRSSWPARPVWIAASTREGEDVRVLEACEAVLAVIPDALLLLVPRHPERFRSAGNQARSRGLEVAYFSETKAPGAGVQVLVGDTMGDMALYYGLADVAFVGGSLVPTGCQNLIEPASLGLPVLAGPSLFNFRHVSQMLIEAGGMRVVQDPVELAAAVVTLLRDETQRSRVGEAALAEVHRNEGATQRQLAVLDRCLSPAGAGDRK